MPAERFEIMNEKEQLLRGVIETEHPRKRQPVVLFLNGFLDTMETAVKLRTAEAFRKAGYVTVRFDYTYGFGEGSGDASGFTLSHQVKDIERVVDHATRRGYVDPARIALIGHCFGSMAAILFAAFDERVKALILLSTPYWFEDTGVTRMGDRELARIRLKRYFHLHSERLGKEVRIDYTFFEDGQKKDMARAVRNLRQPALLVHGSQDESIPPENSEEILRRLPGEKELRLVEGMGHHLGEADLDELQPDFLAFLKKHLK